MATETEAQLDWFLFLEARLQSAVQAAVAAGNDPDDALRGLYISDEQALALAAEGGRPHAAGPLADASTRLAQTAERLGLDALDSSVLALSAAPELHPRFGRLYAYLQDDVTRRLASPRLAADLLAGEFVARSDVLTCFGPDAPLSRRGAIRLPPADATATLADRPIKVADRLTAFLLGAGDLAEAAAGVRLACDATPIRSAVVRSRCSGSRCCSPLGRGYRSSSAARMPARFSLPRPASLCFSSGSGS